MRTALFLAMLAASALGCSKRGDADACVKSCECETLGWCGPGEHPIKQACEPRNDEDCKKSIACRDLGSCTKKDERCAPGSDADCASSKLCANLGACKFVDGACKNVNPAPSTSVLRGVIRPKAPASAAPR